jgi:hypothetical protein
MRLAVDEVALGHVPLAVLQFPLSLLFHQYCTLIFINKLLVAGETGEA